MYKEDLSLNNLQGFIYHKTKPNAVNYVISAEDLAVVNISFAGVKNKFLE